MLFFLKKQFFIVDSTTWPPLPPPPLYPSSLPLHPAPGLHCLVAFGYGPCMYAYKVLVWLLPTPSLQDSALCRKCFFKIKNEQWNLVQSTYIKYIKAELLCWSPHPLKSLWEPWSSTGGRGKALPQTLEACLNSDPSHLWILADTVTMSSSHQPFWPTRGPSPTPALSSTHCSPPSITVISSPMGLGLWPPAAANREGLAGGGFDRAAHCSLGFLQL